MELHVPHNPVSAIDVVLSDVDAIRELLRRLADQVWAVPGTERERIRRRRLLLMYDELNMLVLAMRETTAEEMPAIMAQREALGLMPELLGEPTLAQPRPPDARGKGQKKKRHRHR